MKKNIKWFLFVSFIIIPINVRALSGNISLSCNPTNLLSNSTVNCTLSGTVNEGSIDSVVAKVVLSSNLEFVSFTNNSIWQGDGNDGSIDLFTDVNKSGNFAIGTFQVKTKSGITTGANENITINSVVFSNSDDPPISINIPSKSQNIRIKSTVNTLSSLSISGGTISFNASTTSYNVTIDSASATISATATDSAATVTGTGTKTLNYGANAFNVVVTSEAGTTKTYTINVTRPDNRSTNNNLSSLTISSGTINFNAATTSYTLTVGKDITSMTVGASLADSKASFVSGYGPRTVNLNVGNNDILIKVNNEKGETKTYTLKVIKEDPRSAVNTLKTLTISSGTLNFQKDILEYKTTVPYNIIKMDVTYEASDPKAKVEVTGNDNFIVGDNTILIKVTAENETVKEYKIIVTRQEEGAATLSNNSYLKSLSVGGYDLNFNKKTLEYNLTIKKEKALDITALPEEKTSKVKIIDNTDLSNGSVIRIIVTSEEGSSREYQINIKVQDNLTLFIYIGLGSLVLVLIIILIIVKAKKKKVSTTPITYPRPVGLSTNNQFNNSAPINQAPAPIVNPNINLEHTLEFPVNKINHDDEEII